MININVKKTKATITKWDKIEIKEKRLISFVDFLFKGLIFHENFQSLGEKLLSNWEIDRTLAIKPETSFIVIQKSLGNCPI